MTKTTDGRYKGWDAKRGQWTRNYKGVRFRMSPERLGLPKEGWTAERSHSAWLTWIRQGILLVDKVEDINDERVMLALASRLASTQQVGELMKAQDSLEAIAKDIDQALLAQEEIEFD